ncbi:MAG: hypothetical protein PHY93_19080 [Bacteriovorax sp.]|nr:hypothetical protein [Bacteriovorax sp.]
MEIKLLKTEEDYLQALDRLAELFDAKIGTSESDEADVLALLVDEYEKKHYPINSPDPMVSVSVAEKINNK